MERVRLPGGPKTGPTFSLREFSWRNIAITLNDQRSKREIACLHPFPLHSESGSNAKPFTTTVCCGYGHRRDPADWCGYFFASDVSDENHQREVQGRSPLD